MKCPKCEKSMKEGTQAVLGEVFGCTRRNQEKPSKSQSAKIQPYYCTQCGYIEFYRK